MKMTQFAKFANNATQQILGTSGLIRENLQSMFSYPDAINVLDPVTVSGNVIFIYDSAPIDAERTKVYISPLQAGEGVPSPDNIRPISGWTDVNIVRCGNVLWNEEWETGAYNTSNGLPTSGSGQIRSKNMFGVPSGKVFIYCGVSFNIRPLFYDKNRTFISAPPATRNNYVNVPTNAKYMNFYTGSGYGTSYGYNISIVPQTVDNYSSYIGQTIPITFSSELGTVYGGMLDVTKGILTVTHGYIASYNGESLHNKWISSMDVYSDGGTPTTGAQVVYELTAPQIYQVTPANISMLEGVNTIYANCGSMELKYYRREGGGNPYV